MKISILGAGNVATQLALALRKAGHTIVEVYNRSDDAGQELAKAVGALFTSNVRGLQDADVYIVAVKDDAIANLASQLALNGKIVAHTSGTKTSELLKFASESYGVFYPLQTMNKLLKVDFTMVPMLVEGSNAETVDTLQRLANTISKKVHVVDEEQRQWIHVAAVFANNFTNHLYGISERLLLAHGLQFDILKPLITRSIENMQQFSPSQLQTGPAARRDMQVIDKHLQLLSDEKRLQEVYRILTDSIISSAG